MALSPRRASEEIGDGMKTTEITFDTSPLVLAIAAISLLMVIVFAFLAWRKSGYDRAIGLLESLRVLIAVMAAITFCQPEWKEIFEPTDEPILAVLSDDSLSMETRDILDENRPNSPPVSRRDWLTQQLQQISWDSLEGRVEVVHESFGSSHQDPAQKRLGTNINHAVLDLLKRYTNLRAVIVSSDGDWNEGESPANAATRMRINDVPIYAVALGNEEPLPDIEVASLEPPTFSVAGKALQVPFTLRSTMATDYEVEVLLDVDSREQLKKRVVVPAMGQVRDVFFWTPESVGQARLKLTVPPHPDEVMKDNNTSEVDVAIKAESLKVLVVESHPRWEYRYLRNALERDPGVDVTCLLFHPGLTKKGGGNGYIKEFPQTDEELAKIDVVFLGDVGVRPGQLTAEDCKRIKGLVEGQASGLIFMPGMKGYQYSLLETELADLYPVVLDETNRRGFGSRVPSSPVLTERGESSLLTKLADTARENAAVWRSLPGFQWRSPAIQSRPGSDVLAIHEQSRAPLLVTKTFGTGKILFMGTDGAWRWRKGVEDKYHYRFWGQVARWMAYQRHMAEGEMLRVFYKPDRPTVGNVVTLHATVLDPTGAPLSDGTVNADLVDPQGNRRKLRFQSVGSDWGLYTAKFSPDNVGPHELTLKCDETSAVLEALIDIQGKTREVVGKPARHAVLKEIANISRGELVPQSEMNRLCELVLNLPEPEPSIRRKQIWASPWWAGTLIALMSVFWVGRKSVGAI